MGGRIGGGAGSLRNDAFPQNMRLSNEGANKPGQSGIPCVRSQWSNQPHVQDDRHVPAFDVWWLLFVTQSVWKFGGMWEIRGIFSDIFGHVIVCVLITGELGSPIAWCGWNSEANRLLFKQVKWPWISLADVGIHAYALTGKSNYSN